MAANNPKQSLANELVTVSSWTACYNSGDDSIVLSCTVTSADSSPIISGVGLILNTRDGSTVASFYSDCSSGSQTVNPALNLPPGRLSVGDSISAVVSGECEGKHFFLEESLTISKC